MTMNNINTLSIQYRYKHKPQIPQVPHYPQIIQQHSQPSIVNQLLCFDELAKIPINNSMTLNQYRIKKGFSYQQLAAFLGIKGSPASTVFRWINGERVPKRNSMKLIEKKTGGKVKPSSFYG